MIMKRSTFEPTTYFRLNQDVCALLHTTKKTIFFCLRSQFAKFVIVNAEK